MIRLNKRLQSIINEIEGNILADIGCDHGKIVVYAVYHKIVKSAVAVDISASSLMKTKRLAEKYGVDKDIKFVVGDGLQNLNNNPDCIVIAGLGAHEIIKILKEKFIDSKYILVPHQDSSELRLYLKNNDFFAHKDYVVKENNKFYDIIVTEKGKTNYKENEIFIGKNTPCTDDFYERINERKKVIENIIDKTKDYNKISDNLKNEWREINSVL